MIGDLKHQYLDLLVSIGFVSINRNTRRRHHEDRVLQMTPREVRTARFSENSFIIPSFIYVFRFQYS